MSITQWPELERPREKFLHKGANTLSDAELLAIFLRTGIRGCSAVDLARNLLDRAGGLRQLLSLELSELTTYKGLGTAKTVQLHATLELCKRFLAQELAEKPLFDSSHIAQDYLLSQLRHLKQEVFGCLFLNTQHHLIAFEILFRGTINQTQVHTREIVLATLKHHATSVIFTHNHPSGDTTPSESDISLTKVLVDALSLIDIKVLDHIIVGEGTCSMAELGMV